MHGLNMRTPSIQLINFLRQCDGAAFARPRCASPQRLQYRSFQDTTCACSGHNKWSKIKHDKASEDSKRQKIYNARISIIILATREGGADPKNNAALASAIEAAKKTGMPKQNIENAIQRGRGLSSSGLPLEKLTIEAMMPPVALMIDVETDRRAHDLQELKALIKKKGGKDGQASFMFRQIARLVFDCGGDPQKIEEVMEVALDLDVDDVREEEGKVVIDANLQLFDKVRSSLTGKPGIALESSEIIRVAEEDMVVSDLNQETQAQYESLVEDLEEYQTVQAVYSNVKS